MLVDVRTERRAGLARVAGSAHTTTLRQAVIDPTARATTVIVIAHQKDRGATLQACAIDGAERRLHSSHTMPHFKPPKSRERDYHKEELLGHKKQATPGHEKKRDGKRCAVLAGNDSSGSAWLDGGGREAHFTRPHDMILLPMLRPEGAPRLLLGDGTVTSS